jgi:hypothetical protein
MAEETTVMDSPTVDTPEITTEDTGQIQDDVQSKQDVSTDTPANEPEKIEIPDKATTEWGRVTKALKNLQEENARLKESQTTREPEPKPEPKTQTRGSEDDHPALRGIYLDENDQALIDGEYMTRRQIIREYERDASIADLKAWRDGRVTADEQAKQEVIVSNLRQELQESISSNVIELSAKMFPDVPADQSELLNEQLFSTLDTILAKKTADGVELSPEMLTDSIAETFTKFRALFGVVGSAQLKDNEQFNTNHPVKPGGTPGQELPKDPFSLPKHARAKLIAAAEDVVSKITGRK